MEGTSQSLCRRVEAKRRRVDRSSKATKRPRRAGINDAPFTPSYPKDKGDQNLCVSNRKLQRTVENMDSGVASGKTPFETDCDRLHEVWSSPQRKGKKMHEILPNLTSTPRHDHSETRVLVADTPDSNKYVSQHHQSFDDSGSLFGDIDFGAMENQAEPKSAAPLRRSSRKAAAANVLVRHNALTNSARNVKSKKNSSSRQQTQVHPIAKLQPQTAVKGNSSVENFICESDDSMNSDWGMSDSLSCSIPSGVHSPKPKDKKTPRTNVAKSTTSEKPGDTAKALSDSELDHSYSQQYKKPKRRSIDFEAASGSQISIEEGEVLATQELLSPKGKLEEKESNDNQVNHAKRRLHNIARSVKDHSPNNCAQTTPGVSRNTPKVTPGSIRARLLRDQRRNSESTQTHTTLGLRAARLREAHIEEALKKAEEERVSGTEFDIGPFYGLPSKVPRLFEQHRGIKTLYQWQHECLTQEAVKHGRNLIYSLPTSGGKTLVAELLMLKELLCKKRDALFILPFVAIVQEKVKALTAFAHDLDFVVEEYAAYKGSMPPRRRQKRKAIYIATIEKAAALTNSLIEVERISEIGLVVIDELHMLGEGGGRGALLEMTISKLLHTAEKIQLVGMSATLNNISDLSTFMNAQVYSSNFRPVELREFVKIENKVYEIHQKAFVPEERLTHSRTCAFPYDAAMNKADPDQLAGLVQEVIPAHSCLVFCPTKKNCENVAQLLCKMLPSKLRAVKARQRHELLRMLAQESNGVVCPVLKVTIPFGLAYHHSGLTMDERRLIEESYMDGTLCLLTCTSTLAAGVNLPAKRVILRSPYVAMNYMSRSQYKQMVGRAGRAGLDSSGESILIIAKKDNAHMMNLVAGPCDVCTSSLMYENHKGMRRLLLSTIGLQITPTLQSVSIFLRRTLCFVQQEQHPETDVLTAAQGALQALVDIGFIQQTIEKVFESSGNVIAMQYKLEVTRLGRAVFKGSIDIDLGQQLYRDLNQARSSLVVANYLHLLYLVTPYDMADAVHPDWMTYLDQVSQFEEDELKVIGLIGLSECYISRKAAGQRVKRSVDEGVVKRFYITLILYNLWKQKTIWDVAQLFKVSRGLVQNILNQASTFAVCIAHFCQELEEFWAYQDLFGNFAKKLSFCFMMDLIPLMEIPGVKMGRAQQMFKAGYKTLQQVAHADPADLVQSVEHLPKKVATAIVTAAKVMLQERVEALKEEAEQMNAIPPKMTGAATKSPNPSINSSQIPQPYDMGQPLT